MGDWHRFSERAELIDGRSAACLNCGASLAGAFCGSCGQRDIPPYPSVRGIGAIYVVVSGLALVIMIYWVAVAT